MDKKYYPEIDGLRALAVICVLLFHLSHNNVLSGGYIGVDVFFVISGYLITGIIFTEMQEGTFHYFQFLGRRIARLYPALLFTVFFILIAGFLIQSPQEYAFATRTLKYTLFSLANIFFMKQHGYWDPSSNSNPALHTWSLGVEQQFYCIFPLLLYFVYNRYKTQKSVEISILFLSLLSFIFAQFFSMYNANANFYFTVSRLFELGAGGFLALKGGSYKGVTNTKKEFLFSIGLILILSCAYTYWDNITYHPGVTTLPIVVGSLLCIMYGDATYAGSVLRNKVVVYLGKISYSVYLIHWPLSVFCKDLQQVEELTILTQCVLFILSLLVASIMYHCVENNYRRISISFFTKTGKIFLSLFILLVVINYVVYISKGLPSRLITPSKEVQELSISAREMEEYSNWASRRTLGAENQYPIAMFVGDSYLGQFVEQIDIYFKHKNQSVLFLSGSACSHSHIYWSTSESCLKSTKDYYDSLHKQLPIIIIENWSGYFENAAYNAELSHINVSPQDIFAEIAFQQKIGKNKMLFILPPPIFTSSTDPSGTLPLYEKLGRGRLINMPYKSDKERIKAIELMIQFITEQPNMSYIETYDLFCKNSLCSNLEPNSSILYYSDNGHLSRYGTKLVWENIGDQVYDFILRNNPELKGATAREEEIEFLDNTN